ncbi:MAG: membrane protein insertion efficiency factor YidD [Deltaproteobacteria bacterium CG_4_10_14_0_2_um_filter_43_8]|nr:MAG: membrane protein insertion efficiency factor YidD [Deltaproteobacteria bacterium CG11_big_fil_rev_8_21_14_0_20_42_23]PJA19255.1 MAG: membrane protein insertion efficiency factor YidD [Deltaproteobacteria bacterium CG_4_10_14_0_2_um_filter_43_8]PJC64131.1 MAG: membrane protein insertion efficiency factor YidD [Deltaproteobacteria bacterium CG_4_9_14_0_2_um_filter_42_21]
MMKRFCLFLIRLYQKLISPFFGDCCRFEPTCSQYAEQAFSHLPFCAAFTKTAWRLLRCHPWGGSGYDPVQHHHQSCDGKCL